MPPETTTLAERYVLETLIASGGMAAVWRAHDQVLARPVAVKLLHSHLADDQEFLERFKREALSAARLSHPNVVAIYDTGAEGSPTEARERNFIVMEHCGGGTLADSLREQGPFEADRVAAIGSVICDALGYAHRAGIVHRDIKPANVLIMPDGSLKVADFGIAKAAFGRGDITTTGSILGTVTYLSPEQVRGEEPDARSDLYSLGILLYELAAGRPPFEGDSPIAVAMKHVREQPAPLRAIKATIPRGLEAVVATALAKDPQDRYASADEMQAALESSGGGGGGTAVFESRGPASPATTSRPSERPPGQTRSLLGVLALIAVAVLLAIFLPRVFDETGGIGPTGDGAGNGSRGGAQAIRVRAVTDFDPAGDGEEHSEDVALAIDGQRSTAWTTENYTSSLESQGKPGVGLVFDLGETREVSRVEVSGSPGSDLEVGASGSVGSSEQDFEVVGDRADAPGDASFDFDVVEGRYWLVWITSLPGSTGTATLAEVRFFGP